MTAPRKRFGQHFLRDPGVVSRIVRAVDPRPGERLVEIGPGRGVLTRPLLERAGALTAIEIDRDLVADLHEACGRHPGLSIVPADVLTVDFRRLAAGGAKLRLVGNLPYNISTPLLFHVLEQSDVVRDMHFMLQKEVVDRICATPGTRDYGRLTLSVSVRAEAFPLFSIGPGAFHPPPKVDSTVVRIRPRPAPFQLDDLACFDRIVKQAFGQRRKTLSNALRTVCGPGDFAAAGIDPRARGETLSPADFARLSNRVSASGRRPA